MQVTVSQESIYLFMLFIYLASSDMHEKPPDHDSTQNNMTGNLGKA